VCIDEVVRSDIFLGAVGVWATLPHIVTASASRQYLFRAPSCDVARALPSCTYLACI
jgi:hypothetical protein